MQRSSAQPSRHKCEFKRASFVLSFGYFCKDFCFVCGFFLFCTHHLHHSNNKVLIDHTRRQNKNINEKRKRIKTSEIITEVKALIHKISGTLIDGDDRDEEL